MQRCPKCNRTYQDDKQKFCTHDGGRLAPYEPPLNEAPTSFDLGATMRTDSSDLGETLLNTAAELNRTMATPPPPPPPPTSSTPSTPPPALNKTVAASSPPPNVPAAPPSQPPPQKTIVAPPPSGSPSTGEIRPPDTQSFPPPTAEIPRPHQTMGFPPPAPASQPSAPWPPAPTPTAHPVQPQRPVAPPPVPVGQITQPVRKPSRLPLIIGVVVVLLLLVGGVSAVAYFMLSGKKSAPRPTNDEPSLSSNVSGTNAGANGNANTGANTSSNANSSTATTTSTFEAPPNSLKFVNSRAGLDGKLAEHYVDFSFYYPRLWTLDSKSGVPGASNFVKVERIIPPSFPQERFAVGWYDSKGTIGSDRASFPNLVQKFDDNLAKTFPEYKKVSEGSTEINSREGYEFRFQSVARGTDKGDITYWGRVVFLPPGIEGSKNGLVLLMFTTSVAADLSSVEEVGKKGELAMIMDTFRFGSNP